MIATYSPEHRKELKSAYRRPLDRNYFIYNFTEKRPDPKQSYGEAYCVADTLDFVDYDPTPYIMLIDAFNDIDKTRTIVYRDMVAKFRYFSSIVKTADGQLRQTATAEQLRISPRVMDFLDEVLRSINAPGLRTRYPADYWNADGSAPVEALRNHFMALNRGLSCDVFDTKYISELKKQDQKHKRQAKKE